MKKIIRLNEEELLRVIKRVVKEVNEVGPDIDDYEDFDEFDDEEIEDYGFDYEDEFDDDEFQKKMKKKHSRINALPIEYGDMQWKKEYEKPYSPIKPSDMSLDNYLKSKNK
jgi:hypothetical protein